MTSSHTPGPSGPAEQSSWPERLSPRGEHPGPQQHGEQPDTPTAQDSAGATAEPDAEPAAQLPPTGDQQVDAALASLLAVQDLPPGEQVEAYVGAHRALQDRLADLEG